MKKYTVIVIEDENTKPEIKQAWTYGQMASGEMTWEFDGMEDGAIYTATRMKIAGKMRYVLIRQ